MLTVPTLKVNPVETSITSGIPAFTSILNVAVEAVYSSTMKIFWSLSLRIRLFAVARQTESFLKVMD